jgi:hypothetical protein
MVSGYLDFQAIHERSQAMTLRVGDTAFLGNGTVAKVVGRDPQNSNIVLDRDVNAVRSNIRHGYLNEIEPDKREEFLSFMDQVKSLESPEERIETLQNRIDELGQDTSNFQFVKYLESEKNHLINVSGHKPRIYKTEDYRLR